MKATKICFIIVFVILLASCKVEGITGIGSINSWTLKMNDEIDSTITNEIEKLDEILVESIKNGDINDLTRICTGELTEIIAEDNYAFMPTVSELINDFDYEYMDKYYCTFARTANEIVTVAELSSDSFYLYLTPKSKSIYVTLSTFQLETTELLMANVYIEQEGEWKLDTSMFSEYSSQGMNALDYYEKAKELDEEGSIIPAYIYTATSVDLLNLSSIVSYKQAYEIKEYANYISEKANKTYDFPIKFGTEEGIEVIGISRQITLEGYFPKIMYITDIELNDENEEAIKAQVYAHIPEIEEYFTGLGDEFEYYVYCGYNELPVDENKQYSIYTTIVEQN